MSITLVPVGKVADLIPALLPYLSKSEHWTGGRATVDDILRFILNGQMHLWVVHKDGKIYGHVITEIKQYPRCKFLTVQYCAGEDNHMQYFEDTVFETIDSFAKDAGCVGVEFIGRTGWKNVATKYGYAVHSVTYQKLLEN